MRTISERGKQLVNYRKRADLFGEVCGGVEAKIPRMLPIKLIGNALRLDTFIAVRLTITVTCVKLHGDDPHFVVVVTKVDPHRVLHAA